MTHIYHSQIDRIIKANKIYRFNAELEEEELDSARIENLTSLIQKYEAHKDQKQIKEDTMKAHLDVLKNSQYQKGWQYLKVEQRMNRLEEYINRKEIKDNTIIKLLNDAVTNNTLKTKHVSYDKIKCLINDISILSIDDNKKYYIDIKDICKKDDDVKEIDKKVKIVKKIKITSLI